MVFPWHLFVLGFYFLRFLLPSRACWSENSSPPHLRHTANQESLVHCPLHPQDWEEENQTKKGIACFLTVVSRAASNVHEQVALWWDGESFAEECNNHPGSCVHWRRYPKTRPSDLCMPYFRDYTLNSSSPTRCSNMYYYYIFYLYFMIIFIIFIYYLYYSIYMERELSEE